MATRKFFGGQAGIAEDALKSRQDKLNQAEREATGEAPPPKKEEEKASPRPPMSKKWYE